MAAGVALIGAATITVSPIAPSNVQLPVASTSSVALSALTDPVEKWAHVIETSLVNFNTIGQKWLADPAPIVRQVIANQVHGATNAPAITKALLARLGAMDPVDPDSVPAAFGRFIADQLNGIRDVSDTTATLLGQLVALMDPADPFGVPATVQKMLEEIGGGEFAAGFTTFASLGVAVGFPAIMAAFPYSQALSAPFEDLADIIDPTGAASQPLKNLARVIELLPSIGPSVLLNGILGPLNAVGFSTATALEDVLGAVMTADPAALVTALAAAPAAITDALINGATGPDGFTMAGLFGGPFGISSVGSVLDVITSIANAIMPAATAGVTAESNAAARTIAPVDDVATPPATEAKSSVVLSVSSKDETGIAPAEASEPDRELKSAVAAEAEAGRGAGSDAITAGVAAETSESNADTTASGIDTGTAAGGDNAGQAVDKAADGSKEAVATSATTGVSDGGGPAEASDSAGEA
jgi:hypothetical protein